MDALKCESGTVSCVHGMTTLATQLEAGRTWFLNSGMLSCVSLARAGTVGLRSWVRPRSSEGWTSSLSCVMKGRLASTVGPVDLTPGSSARASRRKGGKAALSALKAGIAADRVLGRSATVRRRLACSRANANAVVLKSVTRLLSAGGL